MPVSKWLLIAAATAMSATAMSASSAQELTGTLKKIKETGTITVGYRESSVPFSYLDDNQKPTGFAIDICMKIVEDIKSSLKLESSTWPPCRSRRPLAFRSWPMAPSISNADRPRTILTARNRSPSPTATI